MAALEIDTSVSAPAFSSCNIVTLYCIKDPLYLTWESVDIVSVNLRHCHISLASSSQRYWALIADRQQWGIGEQRFVAPKLLRVTSSCVAKWIDEDGDFSSAALIWEWDEITNIPPNISAGSLVSLHMPNLNKGNCPHCCPANPSSAASSSTSSSQQPSTSSDDPHQPATDSHTDMDVSDGSDDGEDDNETLEAHVIKLKGSNYEERYQKALEEVREDMKKKKTVPVRLQFEPTNAEDCNAIEIDAHVNDVWKVIGYIPKHKIPKVTSAMRKGEVVSIKLAGLPKYEYHPKHIGYFATVVVVKKGKWPADDRNNVYNSDLSHIG